MDVTDKTNTVRARGRSLTRGDSPMTRLRRREMEEEKVNSNLFLNDELPKSVCQENYSVSSTEYAKSTMSKDHQDKSSTLYTKSSCVYPRQSSLDYMKTTRYKDNPQHLYGLDKDQSNRHVTRNRKVIKKEPGTEQEAVSSLYLSVLLSVHRIWSSLATLTSKLRRPNVSILILAVVFAGGGILWWYGKSNDEDKHRKETEKLGHVYLAKIESILCQLRKQQQHNEAMENQIRKQKESYESSFKILDDKIESSFKILDDKIVYITKHIHGINGSLNRLENQVVEIYAASMKNDSIFNSHLKRLKTVNDQLGAKVSSVDHDVQALKNNTIKVVQKEVRKELKKEREIYYGENSLCVGKECKFRSSNTVAHVQAALEVYRADALGFPDFALKSAGGSIHGNHHSETCELGSKTIKLFGLLLYVDPRSPGLAITADHQPGDCWHMKGNEGYLVVKLVTAIQPSMVTLEHLDKNIDQYSRYMYLMAPKDCEVYAWLDESGKKKLRIGTFTYQREGSAVQTYSLKKQAPQPISYVELRVLSNWGNEDCTCVYRFRVHGMSFAWTNDEE